MRVILTGAGGFLGQAVLQRITECRDISAVSFTSKPEKLQPLFSEYAGISIQNNKSLSCFAFKKTDILINCAFPMSASGAQMADGLKFISFVLETAVENGVGAVINISSQSVYSQKRSECADEASAVVLENDYAVGKYAGELLTNTICRNIPHTNLRLASLIGTRLERRVVNKFVKQALSGTQIHVADGKQRFGYLDVRDAADGIIRMTQYPAKGWAEIYNLGRNGGYTLLEIAQCVRDIGTEYGVTTDICTENSSVWQNSQMNCSLFQSTFNWSPKHTLADSVRDIFTAETDGAI